MLRIVDYATKRWGPETTKQTAIPGTPFESGAPNIRLRSAAGTAHHSDRGCWIRAALVMLILVQFFPGCGAGQDEDGFAVGGRAYDQIVEGLRELEIRYPNIATIYV